LNNNNNDDDDDDNDDDKINTCTHKTTNLPALTTKQMDVIRLYLSSEAIRNPLGSVVTLVSYSSGLMELEATGSPGNKVFVLNLLSKSNCKVDLFNCF